MLSRALILAAVAVALGCFGAIPADAQNLEAGKSPSQIFSSTCSLCHKSSRGLLKSVSPGSLPGFLRQHYTTSTDMAAAMSAYVLSNGAANAALGGGNLTKQGQEAKSGGAASEPGAEPAGRGRKREASKPDADGPDSAQTARQKAAAERRAARHAARSKAGKDELPPKDEARHEAPKDEHGKDEAAKTEPKAEPKAESKTEPKTEPKAEPKAEPKTAATEAETAKPESPKVEGTRPDPVPAVTPAPAATEKGPDTAAVVAPKPVVDDPNRPLTIDVGPAPSRPAASAAVAASGPRPVPAGKPEPPISR